MYRDSQLLFDLVSIANGMVDSERKSYYFNSNNFNYVYAIYELATYLDNKKSRKKYIIKRYDSYDADIYNDLLRTILLILNTWTFSDENPDDKELFRIKLVLHKYVKVMNARLLDQNGFDDLSYDNLIKQNFEHHYDGFSDFPFVFKHDWVSKSPTFPSELFNFCKKEYKRIIIHNHIHDSSLMGGQEVAVFSDWWLVVKILDSLYIIKNFLLNYGKKRHVILKYIENINLVNTI
jgi:hypothetical protein